MGRDAKGTHFQCPFYMTTTKNYITCEGILKNTTTRHTFKTPAMKQAYTQNYCCNIDNFENCLYYQKLLDLYEAGFKK